MDYYFDHDEALYEMMFDAMEDIKEETEEDDWFSHPSLTAAERNPSLR